MSDTHAACMNFLNALEKIPEVIKSHQERADKLRVDLPTLQAIAARTWGKEDELKALKAELAALDRKITADLAPKHETVADTTDGEEVKPTSQQQQPANITPPQSSKQQEDKSSMVAEPVAKYIPTFSTRHFSHF